MHKKVVLIAHIDDPMSGGGKCIINQCMALGKGRVKAVVLFKSSELSHIIQEKGFETYVFPRFLLNPIQWLKFILFCINNFSQKKHIVHTHTERTSAILNPFLKLMRYKVVTTVHRSLLNGSPWGSGLKSKIFLHIENLVLCFFTNTVIAVSDSLRKELIELRGINSNSVEVVHNCVPLDVTTPVVDLNSETNVVIISILRFRPEKGFDYFISNQFIDLCGYLGSSVRLILLGDGTELGAFEKKAKKYLRDFGVDLVLPGTVKDVHAWLKLADFYIQPSRSEAFGLGVVEASLHCLPIATTELEVFTEVLAEYDGHYRLTDRETKLDEALKKNIRSAIFKFKKGERFQWENYPFSIEQHRADLEKAYLKVG